MKESEKLMHLINEIESAIKNENNALAISLLQEAKKAPITEESALLGDWIREQKVEELLDTKKTSLWKLRKAKKIIATQTRPIFYSLNSIIEYLKSTTK